MNGSVGFFPCSFHELVKRSLAVKYSPSLKETNTEEFLELFLNVNFWKKHKQTTLALCYKFTGSIYCIVSCEKFPRCTYTPMARFGNPLNTVLICTEGAGIQGRLWALR